MSNEVVGQGNEAKLKRDIGLLATGFLVLNGVIGAGIFALPGVLLKDAGIFGPWLIVIFGVLLLSVAWTFAAIASYFNTTGGPVAYTHRAFNPFVAFQTGWLLYIGRVTAIAANINVLVNYAARLWEDTSNQMILDFFTNNYTRGILLMVIIGGLTFLNVVGVKKVIKAINVITFVKLFPILLLILLAIPYVTPEGSIPTALPRLDEFDGLILVVLYAFVGFEGALVTAGETKDAKKTIPRALIVGILVITVIYFTVSVAYMNVIPAGGEDAPLVEMGKILMGPMGGIMIIIAAIFSILGNATAITLAAPRMTFAMAEEGSLPKWFSEVNEKYSTPANSIMFLGGLALFLAVTGTFVYLAAASALARMVPYTICMISLPIIRKKADPETLKNATQLPGGYIIPGIAVLVCLFAIWHATWVNWAYLGGFIVLGSGLYFLNHYMQDDNQ